MAKLFLHIGMPKAGSTSIQEAFDAHRAALRAHGINYPDLGPSHSKVYLALFSAKKLKLRTRVTKHLGADEALEDYDLGELERVLAAELTFGNAPVTVSSGEMLFRFSARQCRDLKAFLDPHFSEIRIVAYLREPIGLANSRAQQNVKGGRETLSAMADLKAIRSGRSALVPHYREALETWMGVFGRDALEIREFDRKAFLGGDLVTDFAALVGVPEDLRPAMAGGWTKTARNAETVLILDRYLERSRKGDRPAFGPLRDMIEEVPGSRFALPRDVLEAVWRASEAEIAWLESVTGRRFFEGVDPAKAAVEAAWPAETRAALEAIVGAPVPDIAALPAAERPKAIDRLCDALVAKTKGRKISRKYARGRLAPLLDRARDALGFLRHKLRRMFKGRRRAGG
ncbi:hypothetical protein [Prosthecomicrobium sp. N25]|uniref:hypothetical protein n=1 Tax=Prosthecomicrobium sp. N25 TaxID=3129254 RepID=UPI003076D32C